MSQSRVGAGARGTAGVGIIGGYGFVVLGLTDSVLGVAWPAIRPTFHEPLSALSLLLFASALGYLATAVPSGHMLNRFGAASTLTTASATAGAACALMAAAPAFWALGAAGVLLGLASGAVDAGLNTVVANSGRVRLLNAIHGAYGVGTVLGPILVTLAIVSAGSWRMPYVVLIGAEVLCSAGWWTVRRGIDADQPVGQRPGPGQRPAGPAVPRLLRERAAVGAAVGVALACAGSELTAGQWAASYLREIAGLQEAGAGLAVAAYWGVFALVRLILALPSRPVAAQVVMRVGCIVALCGAGMLRLGHTAGISVAAFAIVGAGLAPVFPALLNLTAARLGPVRARHVIGWQLAGAGAGGLCISALTGVLLGRLSLLALGPILIVLVLLVLAGSLLLDALASSAARSRAHLTRQ